MKVRASALYRTPLPRGPSPGRTGGLTLPRRLPEQVHAPRHREQGSRTQGGGGRHRVGPARPPARSRRHGHGRKSLKHEAPINAQASAAARARPGNPIHDGHGPTCGEREQLSRGAEQTPSLVRPWCGARRGAAADPGKAPPPLGAPSPR